MNRKNAASKLSLMLRLPVSMMFAAPSRVRGVSPELILVVYSETPVGHPSMFEGYRVVLRKTPKVAVPKDKRVKTKG